MTVRHGREFVKHIVPAVVKPARTLWNEVIGFVFLCFAVIFGFRAGQHAMDWMKPEPGADAVGDLFRAAIATFCTVLTAYFAVTSFLRARKISRS